MSAAAATRYERLCSKALDLPMGDRAELAYALLRGLDDPSLNDDAGGAPWGDELCDLIVEYRAAEGDPLALEECDKGIRAAIAVIRQREK